MIRSPLRGPGDTPKRYMSLTSLEQTKTMVTANIIEAERCGGGGVSF